MLCALIVAQLEIKQALVLLAFCCSNDVAEDVKQSVESAEGEFEQSDRTQPQVEWLSSQHQNPRGSRQHQFPRPNWEQNTSNSSRRTILVSSFLPIPPSLSKPSLDRFPIFISFGK